MKEILQTILMYIQTHLSLNGKMPSNQELIKQLDSSDIHLIKLIIKEFA